MRTFIGIRIKPCEKISEKLAKLSRDKDLKVISPENLHINLKFLGEINEAKAKLLEEKLKKIKFKPFTVKLTGTNAFPDPGAPRTIYAGCESGDLINLQELIETAAESVGFAKGESKYIPHVTLARTRGEKAFKPEKTEFCAQDVDSFELIQSKLVNAAEYRTLLKVNL